MKEYNVDDKVWVARCGHENVRVTCPICFGKLEVTLILGDDSHIITPCNYCVSGYEPARGVY